jgi:hypothetical protein
MHWVLFMSKVLYSMCYVLGLYHGSYGTCLRHVLGALLVHG